MLRLEDVMTREVVTVPESESALRAWALLRSRRIHHLVVTSGKAVAGVITDRDLGGPRGESVRNGRTVSELMTRDPITAAPGVPVRQAARLLRNRSIGCLPVCSGNRLVGIITVSTLLDALGRGILAPQVHRERVTLSRRGPRRGRWGYPR